MNGSTGNRWRIFFDSAFLVAVATGVFYYFGWQYYNGYFGVFGVSANTINFPTGTYIITAVESLFVVFATLVGLVGYRARPPETRLIAFSQNVVFVSITVVILSGLRWWPGAWWGLGIIFVMLIGGGYLAWSHASLLYHYASAEPYVKLLVLWCLFNFLGMYVENAGKEVALGLTTGDSPSRTLIIVESGQNPEISGKLFVLVHQSGDAYYLTAPARFTPDSPLLFAVPKSAVSSATIYEAP